jgi:hypothetical protein
MFVLVDPGPTCGVVPKKPLDARRLQMTCSSGVDGRWAVVHLTFARPDRPPWPTTRFYETAESVESAIGDGEV